MPLEPIYTGQGQRGRLSPSDLPPVDPEALRDPRDYRAPQELAAAVDVALTLGMPLLITGDPGSGKSALADSIAWELGLGDEALRFVVKSDTEARDLFYRFDTVGRFHASQTPSADSDAARFISFSALGKAILHAKSEKFCRDLGLEHAVDHPGIPTRSVVLIDEIDKAPRDVPNDILVEIEQMEFTIPELSASEGRGEVRIGLRDDKGRSENDHRPIVIFTSNREKTLPEPFLRRCVFFHLTFPPFKSDDQNAVTVESIVKARLGDRYSDKRDDVRKAISFFEHLRDNTPGLGRKPALSELLSWLDLLTNKNDKERILLAALSGKATEARPALLTSIQTLLLKQPNDQGRAEELLGTWENNQKQQTPAT